MKIETEEQLLAALGENDGTSKSSSGLLASLGLHTRNSIIGNRGKVDEIRRCCWEGTYLGTTGGFALATKEILSYEGTSKLPAKKIFAIGAGYSIVGLLFGVTTGFFVGIFSHILFPRYTAPLRDLASAGFDKEKISEVWKQREEQYKEETEALLGKNKIEIIGDDY
uniref:Uncharacterized protein n=1 Tax=Meloidogyne enterolobii TaxID=390850 RepID=A0A6V7UQG8_MELEN|nr:unnamed protein product [Meloidogyne enterolobii]